jgi:hypothetical protein
LLKNDYSIDFINFENVDDNDDKINKIANGVARQLDHEIDNYFDKFKMMTKNEALSCLPNLGKDVLDLIINSTKAVQEGNLKQFSDNYVKQFSFSRDAGYYRIMSANPQIIDKIIGFNKEFGWNETMSIYLVSKMRYFTNKALAIINGQIFLPSVNRGREDYLNSRIPQEIDLIIKKAGNLLGTITMPSIKKYIIEKGCGKPKEIMKIIAFLRNEFAPTRNYIHKMEETNSLGGDMAALNEISKQVFDKISGSSLETSKAIVENHYTIGMELVAIPVPFDSMKRRELTMCVQAFTEVIKDMKMGYNYEYEKDLIKNCFKNGN